MQFLKYLTVRSLLAIHSCIGVLYDRLCHVYTDLHGFVLVLAKPKLFVLTGQNTIAKQKNCFGFGFAKNQNKTQNRASQHVHVTFHQSRSRKTSLCSNDVFTHSRFTRSIFSCTRSSY